MPPMVVKPLPVRVIAWAPAANCTPRRLADETSLLEVARADGPKVSCTIPAANPGAAEPDQLAPVLQFPLVALAPFHVLGATSVRRLADPYMPPKLPAS